MNPDNDDDLADLLASPVHRLAYRARVDCRRSLYLSETLAQEPEYNDQLYSICEAYERKFRRDYVEYKNALKAEAFIRHDWDHLTTRQRIALWMHEPMLSRGGRIFAVISSLLAAASTTELVLQTMPQFNPDIHTQNAWAFTASEVFLTIFFTIETVVSLVVHPDRLKYARSITFVLDVVSCTPLYLTMFLGTFVPNVAARLDPLRMFRIFRVGRNAVSLTPVATMLAALRRSVSVLAGPLFFIVCFCFVAAGTMYYAQRGSYTAGVGYQVPDCECQSAPLAVNSSSPSCPKATTPISNGIPTTVWWGFATILTVGFGDIVPNCSQGRIIAVICMITSSVIMAMPIAVLGANFEDEAGVIAEIMQVRRRALALRTLKEHQKVAQLAASGRLHELSSERLEALCRRAGLSDNGQHEDKVKRLYRLFGLRDPNAGEGRSRAASPAASEDAGSLQQHDKQTSPANHEGPAVLTLSECFIEYLRLRLPIEIVDLARPRSDVLLLIDTFFQRVFGWWTKCPNMELAQRLVCSSAKALQRVVPLVSVAEHSIGVAIDGIDPPDVVLPTLPITNVTFGPRMATLRVARSFGMMQYVLIPAPTFRPLVNGEVIATPVELNDRDVINFGSEQFPLLYTFVRLDKFAYSTMAAAKMDEKLPARVWAATEFRGTVLDTAAAPSQLQTDAAAGRGIPAAMRPRVGPAADDVHPDWRLDAFEAPFAPVQRDLQFVI